MDALMNDPAPQPQRSGTCTRCHRPLSDPISVQYGMGPVCRAKSGVMAFAERAARPRTAKQQMLPWSGDVILRRSEDGTATANIPQSVVEHSPTGFEWGYAGSGPADLALNVLHFFVPAGEDGDRAVKVYRGKTSSFAWRFHQDFKRDFLVSMPHEGGVIEGDKIREWIQNKQTGETNGN